MLKRFALALVVLAFAPGWAAPAVSPAASPADSGARKAYVGLFKDNAVAVLDLGTNRLLGTIPAPPGPHGLVITPDGRKVYVSSEGASTVSVIDTATDRVVRSLEVGPTPHGLALSRDGHLLLVAGFGSNQVLLINTGTDRIVGQVLVPQPHDSVISPDGGTGYSRPATPRARIAVQPGPIPVASVSAVAATHAPVRRTLVPASTPASGEPSAPVSPGHEMKLALEADDYSFAPAVLRGEPGQRVWLEVENASGMLHNLSIPEQQIDQDIPPHGKVVVEVTIPQSGMVRFFCKLHAPLSMDGRLAAGEATLQPAVRDATDQTASGPRY